MNENTSAGSYPIGIPGQPWGEDERYQWRARQVRQRCYTDDIVARIKALSSRFRELRYGELEYAGETYPLIALQSADANPELPMALITGGVHGYETSGVIGALEFLETCGHTYSGRLNLLAVPCVSPWAYERVNRWNYDALDPNRNFTHGGPAREATALIELVQSMSGKFLVHIDLHETTDSDEEEFRPALAARDGDILVPMIIPDGFYVVGDSRKPQRAFHKAIISAVAGVTHIAEADSSGEIIGSPIVAKGVIEYPVADLRLCTSITGSPFTTITEVYPDSPRTSPEECSRAQVTAVCAALDYALTQPKAE